MPKCLGIYIEDDVIKYAKVDKNKDILKVDSFNVIFYEKENIVQTLEKIIRETYSSKDLVSINISNEIYNYFEVFAALKQSDKNKSVDLDFELLCSEKGYKKDSLESRFFFTNNKENSEKMRVVHIATNKEGIHKRVQEFSGTKVTSVTPITTSICNLIDLDPKENVIIVNIEKDTKVTTVIGGEIYNIDIIPDGMEDILENINKVENSMKKSYECCKNTTIYTQDSQDLQMDENEHLEDVIPILYKIVTQVKTIVDSTIVPISKVYITGLGTSINNIDLYFQEYISNGKCELLKPFFIENASIKIPIKDYIEVNSAIALALNGLGYGNDKLNFKGKSAGKGTPITTKSVEGFFKGLIDPKKEMTAIDKTLLRLLICVCVGLIGYYAFSTSIVKQIDEKSEDIKKSTESVDAQILMINSQTSKIKEGQENYDTLIEALTTVEDPTMTGDDLYEETVIEKDAIPNLLNRIVYVIPNQVKVISIKNTYDKHIVIEAQAGKYEQLGFFRAVLSTEGILLNVKSTSGSKSGQIVTITIEGDLP